MTNLSDRPPEGNAYEPWAVLRTNHALHNFLRAFRGEPPMPEPDWPSVWAAKEKDVHQEAATYGRPSKREPSTPLPRLPASAPRFASERDAAESIGFPLATFRAWVACGRLPKPLPDIDKYDLKAIHAALDKDSGLGTPANALDAWRARGGRNAR